MSPLAALFSHPPPSFHTWKKSISHLNISSTATKYLWNGLSEETRSVYDPAKRFYEFYCVYFSLTPWSAQEHVLAEWLSTSGGLFANQIPGQSYVRRKPFCQWTMVSALRSIHVDRHLSTKPFESRKWSIWAINLPRSLTLIRHARLPLRASSAQVNSATPHRT